MSDKTEEVYAAVKDAAPEGRISCTTARRIAEQLGVTVREVGKAADALGIKIHACELGCF